MAIESLVGLGVVTMVLLLVAMYADKHRAERRHDGNDKAAPSA